MVIVIVTICHNLFIRQPLSHASSNRDKLAFVTALYLSRDAAVLAKIVWAHNFEVFLTDMNARHVAPKKSHRDKLV